MHMAVKEVYSIRITKHDDEIKEYLEQFPVTKQNKAIKTLLKFGIEQLETNIEMNRFYEELKKTIHAGNEASQRKLDEIKNLIIQLQSEAVRIEPTKEETEDDEIIRTDTHRQALKEALAGFIG